MAEKQKNEQLAKQILNDPILLRKLSDRVYELMLEDWRNRRDRFIYPMR